ncbi:proteasome component region PCI domain-containing protein [Cavenderia fasciculata]|uniref:COP9 signalosome complex subunit 3 n=1 Tax=Cavenderia fasciculata TaxID=261658 RepID=F4QCH5_CACFS|nr:proteasome component region PCI domain-containing protein [Cavenderia fasciculata]EGG13610.1 proteasome component region PCI domain-containing protein [Cavenderia fasciculata]|eukprot:XP_004350314.1 proteasome component region PCI domain-containing protein [Cavenderia fasciculata]
MDAFVNDSSKTELPIKNLKTLLLKHEDNLENNTQHLDQVLAALDPRTQSMAYLIVLKVKCGDQRKNVQNFINQVSHFLSSFNGEQIRVIPQYFSQVSKHYVEQLYNTRVPSRGVLPLKRAVCVFPEKTNTLTPQHADFLQLCILSKCYHQALPIISESTTNLNPEQTNINVKDVLSYFYYAGIIFTALKKYKQALEAFRQAWTAPATALSAIAIEAYKKYYLVYLMVNGTIPGFPKYTPTVVQRTIKNHCKSYVEYGQTFTGGNVQEIHNKASAHAENFQKDKNLGLVKLSIRSIHRRNIKKLTQTFMTLSLKDIAEHVKLSPADAETTILKMIEDGEIFATINQKDGMVSFNENPETYSGNKILNELDTQIHNIVTLESKLTSINEQFATSPAFLKKILTNEKRSVSQYDNGMEDMIA